MAASAAMPPPRIFNGGLMLKVSFRPDADPEVVQAAVELVAEAPLADRVWEWYEFPSGSFAPSLFVDGTFEESDQQYRWPARAEAVRRARALAADNALSKWSLEKWYPDRTSSGPGVFEPLYCKYSAGLYVYRHRVTGELAERWAGVVVDMYGAGAPPGPPEDWGEEMFGLLVAGATSLGVGTGCGYFGRAYAPDEALVVRGRFAPPPRGEPSMLQGWSWLTIVDDPTAAATGLVQDGWLDRAFRSERVAGPDGIAGWVVQATHRPHDFVGEIREQWRAMGRGAGSQEV
jgi:hypothetical protein